MELVFGIDLGTTYSCVAYVDENGKPVVLKNRDGDLITPSVVYYESPESINVGAYAKEYAKVYPDKVASFIKRKMGTSEVFTANGIDYKPEEVSASILKKVVQDAEDTLRMEGKLGDDENVKNVVITCPAYFGDKEREATKQAGELAGLNVLDIINEPTAAAISYGISNMDEDKNVLVYDLGGGTFDITMIHIGSGEIKVICTGGNHMLGGKDWDDRIYSYVSEQFENQTGTSIKDLDVEDQQQLSLDIEKAKKDLSNHPKTTIAVNIPGGRIKVELTNEQFDDLTDDLLTSTIDLTREMFKEAKEIKQVEQSEVSEILLVGGSSKMPQVARRVEKEFGIKTKMYDPDEAVAKGSALYANNKNAYNIVIDNIAKQTGHSIVEITNEVAKGNRNIDKKIKEITGENSTPMPKITNVASHSYGVIIEEGGTHVLFNLVYKQTELPAEGKHIFYPKNDNQKSIHIEIDENFSSDEKNNIGIGKKIGEAELTLPPNTPKTTDIENILSLDESGILRLHAKEAKGGHTVDAVFQLTDSLTPKEKSEAMNRMDKLTVN